MRNKRSRICEHVHSKFARRNERTMLIRPETTSLVGFFSKIKCAFRSRHLSLWGKSGARLFSEAKRRCSALEFSAGRRIDAKKTRGSALIPCLNFMRDGVREMR